MQLEIKHGVVTLSAQLRQSRANKAVVVCAHGYLRSQRDFFVIKNLLAQRGFSTITFDFAGHGTSTGKLISLADQAKQLRRVVAFARTVSPNVIVLGYSLGGLTTLIANCRVKGLILINPVVKLEETFTNIVGRERKLRWKETGIEAIPGLLPWQREKLEYSFIQQHYDAKSYAKQVRCPVLLIQSSNDKWTKPEHAHELAKSFQTIKVVSLRSGHAIISPRAYLQVHKAFAHLEHFLQ